MRDTPIAERLRDNRFFGGLDSSYRDLISRYAHVRNLAENEVVFRVGETARFSGLMSGRLQFARQRMIEEWRPEGFA